MKHFMQLSNAFSSGKWLQIAFEIGSQDDFWFSSAWALLHEVSSVDLHSRLTDIDDYERGERENGNISVSNSSQVRITIN